MRHLALAIAALLAFGCEGASADPGLGAVLRVADAQFVPGKLPAAGAKPEIVAVRAPHEQVLPGFRRERVTGSLSRDATAVLVGLIGDEGYWIVTAGVATLEEPDFPTFTAELSLARDLPAGPLRVAVKAVARDGAMGEREVVEFDAVDTVASGELVVTLRWASNADLDLHVVVPGGAEVWAGDINSFKAPPPGSLPADPDAVEAGGLLDLDSNAGCVLDGRREENVVWSEPPSAGRYTVRVATASLCKEPSAHYEVEAWLRGKRVARALGTSQPGDTRLGAGRGDGVLVLSFEVP